MKLRPPDAAAVPRPSRPARGGWIEMDVVLLLLPHCAGPAPQGAGGLKSLVVRQIGEDPRSRPARGGWIEIITDSSNCQDS